MKVILHTLDVFDGRHGDLLSGSRGLFFDNSQHFSQGICSRMGDIVRQDRAYTIQVVLAVVDMFEKEWQEEGYGISLPSINACMFFLVSCLGGMRGFEVVWTRPWCSAL